MPSIAAAGLPLFLAAATLMNIQLIRKPANLEYYEARGLRYLKKATRDIDLSSKIVREDAKMERRTAGVTGMRLLETSLPTEDVDAAPTVLGGGYKGRLAPFSPFTADIGRVTMVEAEFKNSLLPASIGRVIWTTTNLNSWFGQMFTCNS
ncbi:hypothetical protein FRC17_000197 [Serendipita sp. 399]|nr:hypothetical protein FRC17_000197 [Serendipita sp. 399]